MFWKVWEIRQKFDDKITEHHRYSKKKNNFVHAGTTDKQRPYAKRKQKLCRSTSKEKKKPKLTFVFKIKVIF